MDIRQQLRQRLGRKNSDAVLATVLEQPELLVELLDFFFSNELEGITMAAMTVGNLARVKPAWLQPYQHNFYEVSLHPLHTSVRRAAIRYFGELPVLVNDDFIPPNWIKKKDFLYLHRCQVDPEQQGWVEEELEGQLLDHSIALVNKVDEPAANRVFALLLARNLSFKYPEIAVELSEAIRSTLSSGTRGYQNAGGKTLNLLERLMEYYGL
ncbi:MAG: hypothetical protein AAFQ37_13055 [Bacteroidota bacterium]